MTEGLKGCLFVHSSQQREERTKKRRRSYRAIRLVATVAVGVCGIRSARTVFALFPPSPLHLHRPIKADRVLLYSNPLALRALPLYRCTTQGESVIPSVCCCRSFSIPSVY